MLHLRSPLDAAVEFSYTLLHQRNQAGADVRVTPSATRFLGFGPAGVLYESGAPCGAAGEGSKAHEPLTRTRSQARAVRGGVRPDHAGPGGVLDFRSNQRVPGAAEQRHGAGGGLCEIEAGDHRAADQPTAHLPDQCVEANNPRFYCRVAFALTHYAAVEFDVYIRAQIQINGDDIADVL